MVGQLNSDLIYFGLCTPCTGTSYNILRLKGLAGIIFGQPLRGIIIHQKPGQHNDILCLGKGLEY